MRIVQYLPDSREGALVGIRTTLGIVNNNFTEIKISKEELTEEDCIKIFGRSKLDEYLSTLVRYIIEVK